MFSLLISCFFTALFHAFCRVQNHLMTLSALTSTFGGIVSPICLAALRFITNSNFVGSSTGRSAGFVPFKILSTYTAARRYASAHYEHRT